MSYNPYDGTITLAEILRRAKESTMLTIYRNGQISMTTDCYETDSRVCIDLEPSRKTARVAMLSGYDPEKHGWTKEDGQKWMEVPNQRGAKALDAWCHELNVQWYGFPRPVTGTYYRRNGRLEGT